MGRIAALVCALTCACSVVNRAEPASTRVEVGAAAGDRQAPPAGRSLRVVTFNVHQEPAAAIARALTANARLRDADVILLQEIEAIGRRGLSEAAKLARALNMHHAYAPGYGLRGGGSHGVAILSRYPLVDVAVIELPRLHVVVNSARRVALGATVLGTGLRVYSVHLDNRINPATRARQLAGVLARARTRDEARVVIAGDLNTSPFCWFGRLVPVPCRRQAAAVEQLAQTYGFVASTTRSGPTSKWLRMRLDGAFVRGARVTALAVERSVTVSDHRPLWFDLN